MSVVINPFSFSSAKVPPVARIMESIWSYRETGKGNIEEDEFPNDRDVLHLNSYQPQWLKRIALKIRKEFPGGFPPNHAIFATLLRIAVGADEQEEHTDSGNPDLLSWNVFIPLTHHKEQGSTVFKGGIIPSRMCRNYLFDSNIKHYGQANKSSKPRWVLVFVVETKDSFWAETRTPVAL
jgi:hypothetical protein